VSELETDIRSKIKWALDVEAALIVEVNKQTADLVKAVEALHHTEDALQQTEKELQERTLWALRLKKEATDLAQQVELYRASRWVRLGRKVGLGPVLPTS
jgi:hypothetical protein